MRRSDRIFQQRQLQAITKQLGGSAYQQSRLADLLDMHLTRRGLCIVTIDERNLLPHPTASGELSPVLPSGRARGWKGVGTDDD